MRYAASTNGFYPEDTDYPNLPSDVIEITDEMYALIMLGQLDGKFIVPGPDGLPTWAAEPSVTDDILYEQELKEINSSFDNDVSSLVLKFSRIGLFDGENEAAKKSELYDELQERKSKYAADLDALDIKYGG